MPPLAVEEEITSLVDGLHYKQKVERSLDLLSWADKEYGDDLVVANSLGKDSVVVWHLAKRVNPAMRGFIVTTLQTARDGAVDAGAGGQVPRTAGISQRR